MSCAGKKSVIVFCCIIFLGILFKTPLPATSAEFNYGALKYECGLRLGWGQSFGAREQITLYSVLPRWGMFLTSVHNPVLGKLRLSFVVEGILSVASAHHEGWEIGFTPLLKLTYPLGTRVLAFLEGGAGIIMEKITSPAIAHTFNFSPQIGAGLDFRLTPQYAITLAYRFRHSSNAGFYNENPAFNCNFVHVGLTHYY